MGDFQFFSMIVGFVYTLANIFIKEGVPEVNYHCQRYKTTLKEGLVETECREYFVHLIFCHGICRSTNQH